MSYRARGVLGLVAVFGLALVSCSSEEPIEVPESITSFQGSDGSTASDAAPTTAVPTTALRAPASNLVDPAAFEYGSGGTNGYYFTTPSGLWRCAVLADSAQSGSDSQMAGCQPKTSIDMPVAGAPQVQRFGAYEMGAPNAILVNATEDARFASLSQALFWRMDDATPVLAYGQTLSVSGFTCNVQESGVSCRSDSSGKGFQFSTGGYRFEYVEASGGPVPEPGSVAPAVEPVLGRVWGPNQAGYGEVRPTQVYNGGSPSGSVGEISWQDWGGPEARGSGRALNVAVADSVASAPMADATVVAFDLGDCDGIQAYRSVLWFFPSNGETFESARARSSIHPCDEQPYR
ncbi:hypothetical protein [Rhodococcoides fascians]|uniref:hypothetical protein n=1 Tax=Rhodococcoides fascians TaxID=1828 RepID=UPI000A4DD2B5|nr:hypothetical protein [Rhodococcus fascians]